ncbi:GNAT family N-acetyltransferase [Patescibacteria group bacterium]|nr:GNAT family N-acetyltransferase [Patescibacteria group bacterium]
MEIDIKKAKKEDYYSFLEILEESEEKHRLGVPWRYKKPESEFFTKNDFEKMIKDQNCNFLIAKEDEKVLGYIIAYKKEISETSILKPRKYIFINDLAVKDNYKRQGVGSLLMEKIEEWAREIKINEIELNVWFFNKEAFSFYEERGYKVFTQEMRKVII